MADLAFWPWELQKLMEEEEEAFFKVRPCRSVDSTNEELKRLNAMHDAPEGLVSAAAVQTRGKGRLGRSWASPMGESACFSFLLRPAIPADRISMLTLVMGLSVAEAVRELYALPCGIKWPNDVVIDHRKICGILTEASAGAASSGGKASCDEASAGAEAGHFDYIIIGTGINVNNESFSGDLRDKAVSLKMLLGRSLPPEEITAAALRKFARNYRLFCGTCDLRQLTDRYNALLVSRDQEVRIEDPQDPHIGISRGIDARGRLIVDRGQVSAEGASATREYISSGEVSVRGLCGYI